MTNKEGTKPFDSGKLLKDIKELDVKNAAIIDVDQITFSNEVRGYCEQNQCGKYGINWACPPGVGLLWELEAEARVYQHGVLLQKVHKLSSSFDFHGMMDGKAALENILRTAWKLVKEKYGAVEMLVLGAGACEICPECTFVKGEPCRQPKEALASMEAYGIDVMSLVKKYDIPYNHGPETVSYVGLVLFNI